MGIIIQQNNKFGEFSPRRQITSTSVGLNGLYLMKFLSWSNGINFMTVNSKSLEILKTGVFGICNLVRFSFVCLSFGGFETPSSLKWDSYNPSINSVKYKTF